MLPRLLRRSYRDWLVSVVALVIIWVEVRELLLPPLSPSTRSPPPSPPAEAHLLQDEKPHAGMRAATDTQRANITVATQSTSHPSTAAYFLRSYGWNPEHCRVQPNRTEIDPYKGCPLPGLSNLLFTQTNRWYCAVRDQRALQLRDRSCNKGSQEPFRFSSILQIDYDRLARDIPGRSNAAICWSDISRQDKAPSCEWADIPKFYGTPLWWSARKLIDFHPVYYELGARFAQFQFQDRPFLAVHLRRGDYWQHCVVIKRRGIPPWESFRHTAKRYDYERGCYPSLELVAETLRKEADAFQLKDVFIATNTPDEFDALHAKLPDLSIVASIPDAFFRSVALGQSADDTNVTVHQRLRRLDKLIIEVVVLSMGSAFLFNRYSSLSGLAYEMAVIHNRATVNGPNVACW